MTTESKKKMYRVTVSQDIQYVKYWDFAVEAHSKKEAEKIMEEKMFGKNPDLSYEDAIDTYDGDDSFEGMNRDFEIELLNSRDYEVKEEQIIKAPCKTRKSSLTTV